MKTLPMYFLIPKANILYKYYSFALFKNYSSLVPDKPISQSERSHKSEEIQLDLETVHLIERLSLVRFNDQEGAERLKESIRFANQLFEVDTTNVEPLYSVQENKSLKLRDDVCTITNCRKSLLKTAVKTDENYFVAPPGNIPLDDK